MFRLFVLGLVVLAARGSNAQETAVNTPSDVSQISVRCGSREFALPAPTMRADMSAQTQAQALQRAAGKYSLDRFTRDSIVAPFVFDKETLKDNDGKRVGYRLDVWFVAQGSLETVKDRELFSGMVDADEPTDAGEGSALTAEQKAARNIQWISNDTVSRELYQFSAPILDRVHVAGVVRTEQVNRADALRGLVQIDPRFNDDSEFANRWWPEGAEGGRTGPQAKPYSGFIGYAQAIPLHEPAGALLVEAHAVVCEPYEWFDGKSLLSSKLPLMVQDSVRSFRRELSKTD